MPGPVVPNCLRINQRNALNTADTIENMPLPAAGLPGVVGIDPTLNPQKPVIYTLGAGFSVAAGNVLQFTGNSTITVDWTQIQNRPSTFAPSAHTHSIAEVSGLQTVLDSKSDIGHLHTIANVVGLDVALSGKADVGHTHSISDVTDLKAQLDGKSNVGHSHSWTEITDKPTTFAPSSHTHSISDVTGLQTALDGKAALSHTHTWGEITDKPTTFTPSVHTHLWADITDKPATFAPSAHTHTISEVTGLQTTLDGKAAVSHTHAISDVTGLQAAIDGKAALSHTHTIANVTGLQAALDSKFNTPAGTTAQYVRGDGSLATLPVPQTIQRLRVQTDASGNYTWTLPTPYGAGVIPVVSAVAENASTSTPFNVQITSVSNTSVTVKVLRSSTVSVLGILVLGEPVGAQAYVHLMAVAP